MKLLLLGTLSAVAAVIVIALGQNILPTPSPAPYSILYVPRPVPVAGVIAKGRKRIAIPISAYIVGGGTGAYRLRAKLVGGSTWKPVLLHAEGGHLWSAVIRGRAPALCRRVLRVTLEVPGQRAQPSLLLRFAASHGGCTGPVGQRRTPTPSKT